MPEAWRAVTSIVSGHRLELARAAFWSVLLAISTGLYGLLAGPLLRVLFGGDTAVVPGRWDGSWASELVARAPWLILCVALVKAAATNRQVMSQSRLGQAILRSLRARGHRAVLAASPEALGRLGAGDVLTRLLDDVERVEALCTVGVTGVLRDGLQVMLLVALCFGLDVALAGLFFCAYPAALWPLARFGRGLRRSAGTAAEERGALATEAHQQLHRLPLLQVRRAQPWAVRRFETLSEGVSRAVLRGASVRAVASPLMEVLGALALCMTVVYARERIEAGTLSAETVLSFLATALLLYGPIKGLTRAPDVFAPGLAALERLRGLERTALEGPSVGFTGERPGPLGPPGIELSGLRIHRADGRGMALEAATIPAGRMTAVVGRNGAGKTTLALGLLGRLVPIRGEISVDGAPLSTLSETSWLRAVGWVPQSSLLSRGTLRENVGLGDPSLTAEDFETAADLAGLTPLLDRLPGGWDAMLDDGGEGLSGGEQRRVALARALVHRPVLLILDEPEASLDDAAIEALSIALKALRFERTIILMTHDPRLADAADVRIELVPAELQAPEVATPCSPSAFVS